MGQESGNEVKEEKPHAFTWTKTILQGGAVTAAIASIIGLYVLIENRIEAGDAAVAQAAAAANDKIVEQLIERMDTADTSIVKLIGTDVEKRTLNSYKYILDVIDARSIALQGRKSALLSTDATTVKNGDLGAINTEINQLIIIRQQVYKLWENSTQ